MKMPGLTGAVCIQYWNYTDCKWNKNPLELAEVDHCFTVWTFCLWGTQTGNLVTWQFGVRAFFYPLWNQMCVPMF